MKYLEQVKILIVGFILTGIFSFTILQLKQEDELIIGTWVSEDSLENRLVFSSDGTMNEYINVTELFETYNYSISSTSPQCRMEVNIGPTFSYLKIININDSDDMYCYEILSLNDEYLQIRILGTGNSLLYKKSKL